MSTKSMIVIEREGYFEGIICEMGGHPIQVGSTLSSHYKGTKEINELFAIGNLKQLGSKPEESQEIDGDVRPYYNASIKSLTRVAERAGCKYLYTYANGIWFAHQIFRGRLLQVAIPNIPRP